MRMRFRFVITGLFAMGATMGATPPGFAQEQQPAEEKYLAAAKKYLTEHDENKDGYLQKMELPLSVRDRFSTADSNDDDKLTAAEINNGRMLPTSAIARDLSRQEGQNDRNWSQWWDSWWQDENNSSNRDTGAESGARQFVKQHDGDDDGYVERNEMPLRMRDEFDEVDRNDDGYLSMTEVRNGGLQRFTNRRATAQSDKNAEESWSEWWSSWWDDNDGKNTAEGGAKQFVTRYDANKDGFIAQPEMPRSMRDEFAQIDRDDDQRLSNSEIQQYAQSNRQVNRRSRTPVEVAFVWITTPQQGRITRRDLQEAYSLLYELDANHNGRISQSELDEHRERAVTEWCDECFVSLDDDNNSRLSPEEAKDSVFESEFDKLDRDDNRSLSRDEIRTSVKEKFDKSENSQVSTARRSREEK